MPASPLTKTTCPSPAVLCAQRRRRALSSSSHQGGLHGGELLVAAGRRQQATHPAHRQRLCDPAERMGSQVFEGKVPSTSRAVTALMTTALAGARPWSRAAMLGVSPAPDARAAHHPHLPHHDRAGVDADRHGEWHPIGSLKRAFQGGDGLDHAQAGVHGAPSVVFMRRGVAK